MKKRINLFLITICLLLSTLIFYSQKNVFAPKLSFTSLQNHTLHPKDWENKVILVNFWATSCPSCIQKMPQLIKIHQQFAKDGFEIIAVAMQYDSSNFVMNYVQNNPLPFFVTLDVNGTIAKAYGDVSVTPTSFLINRQGKIIHKFIGEINNEQLNSLIATNLSNSS